MVTTQHILFRVSRRLEQRVLIDSTGQYNWKLWYCFMISLDWYFKPWDTIRKGFEWSLYFDHFLFSFDQISQFRSIWLNRKVWVSFKTKIDWLRVNFRGKEKSKIQMLPFLKMDVSYLEHFTIEEDSFWVETAFYHFAIFFNRKIGFKLICD